MLASKGGQAHGTNSTFASDIHPCGVAYGLLAARTLCERCYPHCKWPQLRDFAGGFPAATCGQPLPRILRATSKKKAGANLLRPFRSEMQVCRVGITPLKQVWR